VNQSQSAAELKQLFAPQNPGILPDIPNPQQVKTQLLSEVTTTQKKLKSEFEVVRQNQQRSLLKNALKWNLGALLSGVVLIYLWRLGTWARRL
jgi:hypothetical protein